MLTVDALLVCVSYYAAYLIRFDGVIDDSQLAVIGKNIVWIVPVYLGWFLFNELYKGMWRYTSLRDLLAMVRANLGASCTVMMVILFVNRFQGYPRSVYFLLGLLSLMLTGGFRVGIRLAYYKPVNRSGFSLWPRKAANPLRLLVIGAGSAGEKLVREISENSQLSYDIIGFIDDNPSKINLTLHGVPVLGNLERLAGIVEKAGVNQVIIAAPSADSQELRRMINACKAVGVEYKTVPGMGELINGSVTVSTVREVKYDDLLKRDAVHLENEQIFSFITGRRVMVTGGAGSIGSELCRQIARFGPKCLILVERSESGLYDIALDMKTAHPELEVISSLAAVHNQDRMHHIFTRYQPEVVFHAAAYKHVPMMELHPWEAIFNNVVGSLTVLDHCHRFNVARCVMISTDKAVRPTNVMGATKRLVELLTQSYSCLNGTRFMAVRFGNVLGSVGSVLPLFKKQIAAGGPVTVTHPNVTRYFMTIPEACSLILQAGAMGRGGEIFVLKMGTPVRIADMARDLITLSGYKVGEDIKVRYTGLRPGEKLYEELITQGEGIQPTEHEDIMVLNPESCRDLEEMAARVGQLVALAKTGDAAGIRNELKSIIPEYHPNPMPAPALEPRANSVAANRLRDGSASDWVAVDEAAREILRADALDQAMAMKPEDRLLLQILGETSAQEAGGFFSGLTGHQWEAVLQRAIQHSVAPLLFQHLKNAGLLVLLPKAIRDRLERLYFVVLGRNMRLFHHLGKVLKLLNAAEIPVILLKGSHLVELVYGNLGLRPMGDFDLLFHHCDLTRAHQIITQSRAITGDDMLPIDAHWYLTPELSIDMDRVWDRSLNVIVGGQPVRVLSPEDLILHLCLHIALHHKYKISGLRNLLDIKTCVMHFGDQLDWDVVMARAGRWQVGNSVVLTILLGHDLVGISLPSIIRRMAKGDGRLPKVRSWAIEKMFEEQNTRNLSPYFFQMWNSPTLGQRMAAFRRVLFPPREFIFQTYHVPPRSLKTYFYYLVRIKDRLGFYCMATLKILLREKEMLERLAEDRRDRQMQQWFIEHGRGPLGAGEDMDQISEVGG